MFRFSPMNYKTITRPIHTFSITHYVFVDQGYGNIQRFALQSWSFQQGENKWQDHC